MCWNQRGSSTSNFLSNTFVLSSIAVDNLTGIAIVTNLVSNLKAKATYMNTNSRFVVAIHIMVTLAAKNKFSGQQYVRSDQIAESVNTNPVVIRRIMGSLKKAGFVESISGPYGGYYPSRAPEDITLADIFSAVEDKDGLFQMHSCQPNQECLIGKNIQPVLCEIFKETYDGLIEKLEKVSLMDITAQTVERSVRDKYQDDETPVQELVDRFVDEYQLKLNNL